MFKITKRSDASFDGGIFQTTKDANRALAKIRAEHPEQADDFIVEDDHVYLHFGAPTVRAAAGDWPDSASPQ